MKNTVVNSNPFVVAPTGDTANFAENNLCIIGSGGGGGTTILPLISSLRAGDFNIYLLPSGGNMAVAAQGGNTIVGSNSIDNGKAGVATAITPTVWFVR